MIKCIKYASGFTCFAGLKNQHGLIIPTSPYAMFEELYNACVTDEDKQATIEKMATKMICRSLPSMEAVPVLTQAVKDWKKKAGADKTWKNFKKSF